MRKASSIVLAVALMFLGIYIIFASKKYSEIDGQLDSLKTSYSKLIKGRGYYWQSVNIAPDSIYFINFDKDTIWYYREDK